MIPDATLTEWERYLNQLEESTGLPVDGSGRFLRSCIAEIRRLREERTFCKECHDLSLMRQDEILRREGVEADLAAHQAVVRELALCCEELIAQGHVPKWIAEVLEEKLAHPLVVARRKGQ